MGPAKSGTTVKHRFKSILYPFYSFILQLSQYTKKNNILGETKARRVKTR